MAFRGGGSHPPAREARDPARQALRPGCEELAGRTLRRQCRRRKRGPRPKIATVERREACVPWCFKRKGRATPRKRGWSRLASATGLAPSRRSAPRWGEGKERERRGARARRSAGKAERWLGLFDIVRFECGAPQAVWFTDSAADSVCSLPPCGGGRRGVAANSVCAVTPLPVPPPQGGRERWGASHRLHREAWTIRGAQGGGWERAAPPLRKT